MQYMTDDEQACNTAKNSSARSKKYPKQLSFWQGASERDEGVYMQYMTDDEQACNTAKNSSVKGIEGEHQHCSPFSL
jgi:hypothetical protein